jgi:hypothetical protein
MQTERQSNWKLPFHGAKLKKSSYGSTENGKARQKKYWPFFANVPNYYREKKSR